MIRFTLYYILQKNAQSNSTSTLRVKIDLGCIISVLSTFDHFVEVICRWYVTYFIYMMHQHICIEETDDYFHKNLVQHTPKCSY